MDFSKLQLKDLYEIASSGSEADTALNVLAPIIEAEKRMILTQLATAAPDLGTYAHIAGRAKLVLQIERLLEARKLQGKAATSQLNVK